MVVISVFCMNPMGNCLSRSVTSFSLFSSLTMRVQNPTPCVVPRLAEVCFLQTHLEIFFQPILLTGKLRSYLLHFVLTYAFTKNLLRVSVHYMVFLSAKILGTLNYFVVNLKEFLKTGNKQVRDCLSCNSKGEK